jgi:hypothetical protein
MAAPCLGALACRSVWDVPVAREQQAFSLIKPSILKWELISQPSLCSFLLMCFPLGNNQVTVNAG